MQSNLPGFNLFLYSIIPVRGGAFLGKNSVLHVFSSRCSQDFIEHVSLLSKRALNCCQIPCSDTSPLLVCPPRNKLIHSLNMCHLGVQQFDFGYWTGDLPPHDVWKITQDDNLKNFEETTSVIRKRLKGLIIYPVVGNHEAVPPNLWVETETSVHKNLFLHFFILRRNRKHLP